LANVNPALVKQILDIPEGQREADVVRPEQLPSY
jgi:hypothetical protein